MRGSVHKSVHIRKANRSLEKLASNFARLVRDFPCSSLADKSALRLLVEGSSHLLDFFFWSNLTFCEPVLTLEGSEEEKTCRISDKDEKLVRDVSPSQGLLQSAINTWTRSCVQPGRPETALYRQDRGDQNSQTTAIGLSLLKKHTHTGPHFFSVLQL